jgi:hypothetical protein
MQFGTDGVSGGANAKLMFNNLIPLSMKRIFVLLFVALMSALMLNAKTVRGYVSDKDGNPVVGMKMVVVNADNPSQKSIAVTDDEGHFSMTVPENLDTSDLVDVFASNGARVVRYRETSTGILIVVETSKKRERALAQK